MISTHLRWMCGDVCLVQNRLLDGVTAETRFPLLTPPEGVDGVQPLSPFVFVNVPLGMESRSSYAVNDQESSSGGSLCNLREVDVIKRIIHVLLIHGIEPSQIGVIAPYRAQAWKIRDAVQTIVVTPTVTQPRAPMMEMAAPASKKSAASRKKQATTTNHSNGARQPGPSAKADFARSVLKRPISALALAPPAASCVSSATGSHRPAVGSCDLAQSVSGAGVQVSTVDAFQGAEKVSATAATQLEDAVRPAVAGDRRQTSAHHAHSGSHVVRACVWWDGQDIIIFSCVRSGDTTDFLDTATRLNVSLTRAKHHLIIVGKKSTLECSSIFKSMIQLSHSKPMSYAPNIGEFDKHIMKLNIHPNLLQPTWDTHGATIDRAAVDEGGAPQPIAFSLRNLAREQADSAPKHRRVASRVDHVPDEEEEDEEDFLDPPVADADPDDEDVPVAALRSRKRRRSEVDTVGLSPIAAQAAIEEAMSDTDEDADADVDEDDAAPSLSIHALLRGAQSSERARRAASEAHVIDAPTVDADDEEAELQFAPIASVASRSDTRATDAHDQMHEEDEDADEDDADGRPKADSTLDQVMSCGPPHAAAPIAVAIPSAVGSRPSSPAPFDLDAEMAAATVPIDLPHTTRGRRRDDVQVRTKRKKTNETTTTHYNERRRTEGSQIVALVRQLRPSISALHQSPSDAWMRLQIVFIHSQ
jgi:hypothetical protein